MAQRFANTPRALRRFSALAAILIGFSSAALSQVAGGELTGVVSDNGGAAIPNASISIRDTGRGETREVRSSGSGVYSAPNLLPGSYNVTVTAPGFSSPTIAGVVITVGGEQVLNIELTPGSVTQSVKVTTSLNGVQLASSSVQHEVDASTIRELPLNGRDWTQLAALQPGVSTITTQPAVAVDFNRGNRGFGTQLTISGGRPQQNNYRLDGISVNDYSNGGPGSVLGITMGVDAIQEFSVLTSNYSAEYGRTSGGVVNSITRSGTNDIHGSAYEFLRNSALDAQNFFDARHLPFKRNQFGGSLGAPIRRGRTFAFADYEGLRQSLGVTFVDQVPSPNARAGQLADGTVVAVDPAIQRFLAFYALPNGAMSGNTGLFRSAGQQIAHENFLSARLDHKLGAKDSLAGTYQYDDANLSVPDKLNDVLLGSKSRRQTVAIEQDHSFTPQLLNSFRLGVNRVVAKNGVAQKAINPLAADTSLGTVPGQAAAQVSVPGLTPFTGGFNASSSYFFNYTSYQLYDDAFFSKGRHQFKFGFAFERLQNNLMGLVTVGGSFKFGSLVNFLTNKPSSFTAELPSTVSERGLRQSIVAGYFQDDFQMTPRFTANLGLRYEMSTVPTEVKGKLTALRSPSDPQPHLGNPYFDNPTFRNFEPRIGFAWSPTASAKTAVRAGIGLFDVLPLLYQFELLSIQAAPYFIQGSVKNLPAGSYPTQAFSLLGAPSTLRQSYVQPNPRRNYVGQWNLSAQQELATDFSATVSYVGTRGIHQPFRADDINIVQPVSVTEGYLWPSPAGSGTPLNPHAGQIGAIAWVGDSYYHSLQATVLKNMSHGFRVQGSYTWSKSIDTGSSTLAGDPFGNSISSLFLFNPNLSASRLRRGLSDFNVAHNLVINYLFVLPGPTSANHALAFVASGWELGGVMQASSGVPFTPIISGDPLGLNSTDPYDYPDRLAGGGCKTATNAGNIAHYIKTECFAFPSPSTRLGSAGRNSLIGPGLQNFDLSLFKNQTLSRIHESWNAQLRVEVFNALNHPNFAPPTNNNALFDETGGSVGGAGQLDTVTTSAREIQFGLKLTF
ncbi:MAG: TonB-dependent receptor plug [Acidobacteriaceae bacterium]|nr:TonB-dependent receptor plug [Acidobacteriaceae bacterium]